MFFRRLGLTTRRHGSALSVTKGKHFTPQNLTTDDILLRACETHDSQLQASFEYCNVEFTFGQTNQMAEKLASGLIATGLKEGDNVAILGPNMPEWFLLKWACAKAGFPLVSINPLYTASELEYALKKVNVKCLICPKETGPLNYNNIIHQMIPNLDDLNRNDLKIPKLPDLSKVIYFMNDEKLPGVINWSDVMSAGDGASSKILAGTKVLPEHIGNIQFTSGTTGMPKAAALTHFSLVNNLVSLSPHLNLYEEGFNKDSILLNVLPLYHIFSYLGGSLMGAYQKIPNIFPTPGFSGAAGIIAAEKRKATMVLGTPTMFIDILNSPILPKHDLSSLKYAVLGGSPVTPSLAKASKEELDCTVSVAYGMTETTGASFAVSFGASDEEATSTCGKILPGIEGKLIDENENIVELGQMGELATKSDFIFQGYVNDEKKTKEGFTKDGFWKSGDLAVLNKDGTLRVVGRSKDMIIRGGENIQPTEIEDYIVTMEKVEDAYVIGVPNKRLQEEVAVYIKPADSSLTEAEVTEFCTKGLARFKVPKFIKFVEDYPKTTTGKVQKFKLQQLALEDFPELKKELE